LAVEFRPVDDLLAEERESMWNLYSRFYSGTSQDQFFADLEAKHSVLQLRDSQGSLQGFTTVVWWDRDFEGAPVRVLFSGDTIIDVANWGSQALAFNWLRFAGRLKQSAPDTPLYWFLIVKGHRTFRYLPTFARTFIPHWNAAEPPALRRLLTTLARERFEEDYDAVAGVIRFQRSRGHLAPGIAQPSARELMRPDVRFFLERNPGYAAGHELACLCELSAANLKPLARRVFQGAEAA
jgi:hypothetical protein